MNPHDKSETHMVRFVQITSAVGSDGEPCLYALDDEGRLWWGLPGMTKFQTSWYLQNSPIRSGEKESTS